MKKEIILILIVAMALVGLLVWAYDPQDSVTYFENTKIACLVNGHQRLVEHIHPELTITVDGQNETIPANIGISGSCMSEIHTHDETGMIHAESFLPNRVDNFHLGDFFSVWNKDHMREGYDLEIIQDGETKNSIEDVKFADASMIELRYKTIDTVEDTQ